MIGIGIGIPLTPVMSGIGGPRAAMDLSFTAYQYLDNRIIFTRADASAAATRFNSSGLMETFGVNLLTYSGEFGNATYWTTAMGGTATMPVVTANYATGPDGSSGAARLQLDSGAAGNATLARINSSAFTLGNTYTLSIWMKSLSGTTTVTLYLADATTNITVTSAWQKFTFTRAVATTGSDVRIAKRDVWSSSGAADLVIWGAMVELASTASSGYSPTQGTSTSGPRFDYDPATPAGVTGGELVTNGTFADLTGWTAGGNATLSISGGKLRITNDGVGGSFGSAAYIVIPTVVGKRYWFRCTRVGGTGSGQLHLGTTPAGGGYATNNQTGDVYFIATSTNLYITLMVGGNAANAYYEYSNVSVAEPVFTPRGLLIEESRQNLLTYSRDMTNAAWTKTDTTPARTQVGLDGVANTATLLTEGTLLTAMTYQTPPTAVTAGATITASFVFKRGNTDWIRVFVSDNILTNGSTAWFNLNTGAKGTVANNGTGTGGASTITSLGGGWYRCAVTSVPSGTYTLTAVAITSATADNSVTRVSGATYIVDCAQLEVGAFATSIIPTAAATVTRAADNASMTGTNFSSWFNASAGTFVAEAMAPVYSPNGMVFEGSLAGTLSGGSVGLGAAGTPKLRPQQRHGAFRQEPGTTGADLVLGTAFKGAVSWGASDSAIYDRGTLMTNAATPVQADWGDALNIGGRVGGALKLNGYVRRITYYNTRLPNATLQSLTT